MTTSHDPNNQVPGQQHPSAPEKRPMRGGHWVMMLICIPMIVVAVVLVATKVLSISFLVVAAICALVMLVMMGGMSRDGQK